MIRFLIDAQLSPDLVGWLRAKGHQAEHVSATLGERASDRQIVNHADSIGAIIVSKDSDFISLLERRANAPKLLRIRLGNAINRVLLARLDTALAEIEKAFEAGAPIVELD